MHGVRALPFNTRSRDASAAAVAVLVAPCTWGTAEGRARSDLQFYGCAFAQAGFALGATLVVLWCRATAVLPMVGTVALALRLALLPTVPTLSGDMYRYVWDGRVVAAGFDPYVHVPADPALAALPLAVLAMVGLCYWPCALSAGAGVVGFLPSYAHERGLDTGSGVLPVALLAAAGLARPWMVGAYAGATAVALLALSFATRWRGNPSLRAALGGTASLAIAFLCIVRPTFPWYFLVIAPFSTLLGLWSPFVLTTGGFLLYGRNADAPGFLARWSVLMGLALLAGARDVSAWRRTKEKP